MRRADLLEKTLMLGKIEGKRKRGRERMRWLDGITDSMGLSLSRLREIAWHATLHGVTKSLMPLGNWTTKASAKRVCSWWEVNQGQEEAMKPRCYLRDQIQWQPWAITETSNRFWQKDWNEMTLGSYCIHISYTEMDRSKMDDDNGYRPIFYFEKIPFF